MTNDFSFQVFSSHRIGSLTLQLESLEAQLVLWMMEHSLTLDLLMQSRIYLSDAANQWEEVRNSGLYSEFLSKGAVSYIEQPMLNGAKVSLQVWFAKNGDIVKEGTPECMTVQVGEITYIFQSVRFSEEESLELDAAAQTKEAFRRHISVLSERGMTLEQHCHRTWLYVRDIDRHYAEVVAARNQVFDANGLTADSHYISSTGIGGYSDNRGAVLGVDFLSVDGLERNQVNYLHALEYLNPTHEYGVAFERGTRLSLPQGELSLISGTASIDKYGECLHRGDILTQTGRLFLNIEKLLEDGQSSLSDVRYMIVYLRDIADYIRVDEYLSLRFPKIPFLITEARVCRPEWLIEVECIALRTK